MTMEQIIRIDNAVEKLQGIQNCNIENGDIHDHYDCREDMKQVVTDLQLLLNETEA